MWGIAGGTLDKDVLASLVKIARNGFGTPITTEDVKNHVLKVDFVQLLYNEDRLIGFASYDKLNYFNKNILYLSGIVIEQDKQNKGLSYFALNSAISSIRPDIIAMRTQNILMYHIASQVSKIIFPSVEMELHQEELELCRNIGYEISKKLNMKKYEKAQFLERGTYSTALNKTQPKTKDLKSQALFESLRIERERGDSIMVVGVIGGYNGD